MTNEREAHLLDRVRETAKRCIDLGVRVDVPSYSPRNGPEFNARLNYLKACEAALFQLAEVAGSGAMYTKEDVESAREESYDAGYDVGRGEGYEDGYKEGYENAVADQHNGAE